MKNRSPAWSIRVFSAYFFLLLVLSGWVASCSTDGSALSAERWYRGYHELDFQTVEGLTCCVRLPEVQVLLQKNSGTINQFRSHSFDIFQLESRTFNLGEESTIVEVIGIVVLGVILVTIVLTLIFSYRTRNFSEFFTQSEKGVLRQVQEYEAGWIKSFSKVKGYGFIYDDRGKTYSIDYGSFIDQGYHDLTNGERILFQAEWTPRGPRARNIIRVDNPTSSSNPHSRKLVILADRVKKLRQDFRFYKVGHLQKELDTCKSFFELLDLDIKRYGIKLTDYEVVLLYEVEKDLHELSDEIRSMSYDSRWWVRILHVILQTLNVVADIIQIASPQTAELLRSLGRSAGRLLDSKKPPLLGSGKK